MTFDCIIKCAGPADAREVRRLYYLAKTLRSKLFLAPSQVHQILDEFRKPSSPESRRERLRAQIAKFRENGRVTEVRFLEEQLAKLDGEHALDKALRGSRIYGIEQMRNIEERVFDQVAQHPNARCTVSLDIETHGGPVTKAPKKPSLITAAKNARAAVKTLADKQKALDAALARKAKADRAVLVAQQAVLDARVARDLRKADLSNAVEA